MRRRIKLVDPFYKIYISYKHKLTNQLFVDFTYDQISEEID